MSTTSLSADVEQSVSLYLRSGTSDKEYHLYLCKHTDGKYSVHAEYGRRDRPNQRHDKTAAGRQSRFSATKLFDDTEKEKRGEGYLDMSSLRSPAKIPGAVAVAPDTRPAALATALEVYLAATPSVAQAGLEALGAIEARVGKAKMRALPAEVRSLLVAVLGDIACASQDYVDDALATVSKCFASGSARLSGLLKELSGPAVQALESARDTAAPTDTSEQFFAAAIKPVQASGLL